MTMQLLLSIPFRTEFHLHSRFVAGRSEALIAALRSIALPVAARDGVSKVDVLSRHDDDHIGLYTSIDEDVLLPAVLPLFSVGWNPAASPASSLPGLPGVEKVEIEAVEVHYFDHTVAIMELRLRLSTPVDPQALSSALDRWTFALALRWLEEVGPVTLQLERALREASASDRLPVGMPIAADGAFFDRLRPVPRSPRGDLLWVSRVLVLDAPPQAMQWLRDWAQDRLTEDDRIPMGDDGAALRVGNSVVFGPWDDVAESALVRSLRICNRFYAIAHVLGTNERVLHGMVLSDRLRAVPAGTISQAIRSRYDLLRHEYEDALLGVQGLRRLAVEAYMRAWDFDKLMLTCERRMASVDLLLQAALQRRSLRYTRLVEASLTMIGGLTLLDFSVNLMNFSRTAGLATDKVPGLVDLARIVPEDALLYALLAVILLIVYNKVRPK